MEVAAVVASGGGQATSKRWPVARAELPVAGLWLARAAPPAAVSSGVGFGCRCPHRTTEKWTRLAQFTRRGAPTPRLPTTHPQGPSQTPLAGPHRLKATGPILNHGAKKQTRPPTSTTFFPSPPNTPQLCPPFLPTLRRRVFGLLGFLLNRLSSTAFHRATSPPFSLIATVFPNSHS